LSSSSATEVSQSPPPCVGDPQPRDLDRAPASDHALGRRGGKAAAYKFDQLRDGEAVRQQ
jgi:hypothetical protein